MALLEIRDLKKYFPVPSGALGKAHEYVKAIDGVSFDVDDGETVGLVGESGCGKTSLGRCLVRLSRADRRNRYLRGSGAVVAVGIGDARKAPQDADDLPGSLCIAQSAHARRRDHRRRLDASTALPRATISSFGCVELLTRVGLREEYYGRYPHEFSGGQRQRIGIARALAVNAKFIVADEAVSALDVSIQAQILNMLLDLQQELGLTYLFISHDLRVVEHVSDRVAVMYLGKIVEIAPAGELHRVSQHPYTRALLSAVPVPDPARRGARTVLQGDVPSPINPPSGCSFHPRCPFALKRCAEEEPTAGVRRQARRRLPRFRPGGKK